MTSESPRDRLLRVASELFYREGINGVGVDKILAEAGVTRQTMYRHFPGKEALVVAHLELEDARIKAAFAGVDQSSPLLPQVIEGIAHDATRFHNRGCPFINAAAEFPDPASPVRKVVDDHRAWFRSTLTKAAKSDGVPEPAQVASALVLLRDAMLVGAYLDDPKKVTATFRKAAKALTESP